MDSVVQERVDRLDDILSTRRGQVRFRLGIAGSVILVYSASLGLKVTLAWAAIYGLLQLVEARVYTPAATRRLISSRAGYITALTLITLNLMVFGSLAMIWPFAGGPWGVANAAFLIAGAMLNAVLTTQASAAAFKASIVPLVVYAALLPVISIMVHADVGVVIGLAAGSALLTFSVVKLWSEAHRIRVAEKRARAEAERRQAEAEAAVEAKSAFVAMVSHELRTPISAILAGATELERISGGVGRSHARLIADAGAMMRTLLNDLLDLAKLDAGRMSVESTPFDFRALMSDQIRFWRAEAMKKNLSLRLTGAKSAPGWVEGDPTRLRQVLNNLLSNALKFTAEGSVTIGLDALPSVTGGALLRISVADTGAGMSAEQLERLFTPFDQTDAAVARTHGGTGLGLVISRELARLMGGDITVESTRGEGSTFTVTLAVGAVEAPPSEDHLPSSESVHAMKILLVDDHDINRRAISLMLEPLGAEVTTACSGTEALEVLAGRPFDVVLMDVNMPDMNGRDAVRSLRSTDGVNRATPVIAVTGDTAPGDVQRCLEAGMNDWVAKPIDAGQLYNALARQIGGEADEAEVAAA